MDIYESERVKALAEFDVLDRNEAIGRSLEFSLHNTSDETDYGAWAEGCEKFGEDNRSVIEGVLG
jgi:hypothetical protein